MLAAATRIAALHTAIGLGLFGLGAELSDVPWLRSAGRFDFILGTVFVVLGVLTMVLGLVEPGASLFHLILVVLGVLLFRRYYAAVSEDRRRHRDIRNPTLLALPGACGLLGNFHGMGVLLFVAPLLAIPASLVGLGSILYDAVRLARGHHVYKRDAITALLLLPLGYLYLGLLLFTLNPDFPT